MSKSNKRLVLYSSQLQKLSITHFIKSIPEIIDKTIINVIESTLKIFKVMTIYDIKCIT